MLLEIFDDLHYEELKTYPLKRNGELPQHTAVKPSEAKPGKLHTRWYRRVSKTTMQSKT